jgi:hypothetical protein
LIISATLPPGCGKWPESTVVGQDASAEIGPQKIFASLSTAALQLLQTRLSLRLRNRTGRELMICGDSVAKVSWSIGLALILSV